MNYLILLAIFAFSVSIVFFYVAWEARTLEKTRQQIKTGTLPNFDEADTDKLVPIESDLIVAGEALCEAIMKDLPDAPVNRIPNIAFARQNLLLVIKKARGTK